MRSFVTALAAACAIATASAASAQPVVPAGTPPAPGRPTANLVLDAMLASARAASVNPSGAQAASLNASAAVQRYNMGDMNGARAAAIQALIEANRVPPTVIPVLPSTIPQTSALQTKPFPLPGGSLSAIDAAAFVAQARGAVAACAARGSSNAGVAAQKLAAAEAAEKAGRYLEVTTAARAAVDLCATSARP